MRSFAQLMILSLMMLLAACQKETPPPDPVALTRDAAGHYCNMIVIDHPGPKAQVFEEGRAEPLWFTSVRDAIAYNILPGEAQHILAIYVHDMGKATSWEKPQNNGIWIAAKDAFYVINSSKRGGMGAKETIPFGDKSSADKFAREFGGQVVSYANIPQDYILGDTGEYNEDSD